MQQIFEFFGRQQDPRELVRKWQASLRSEVRSVERQIRDIQVEERKVKRSIQDAARRGDIPSAKALAREVVQSRRAVGRLYTNKAQIISLSTALTEQLAFIRVAGTLSKSGEAMKLVNDMMKIPELNKSMLEMSKEMMKAGLIDEMMNDAIEGAMGAEDIEEEIDSEVAKVLEEVAGETASQLPKAKARPVAPSRVSEVAPEEADQELESLQTRLDAVRS